LKYGFAKPSGTYCNKCILNLLIMKPYIWLLTITFMFTGFACETEPEMPVRVPTGEEVYEPPDRAPNARTALDYYGTYHGVVPCEDCDGIDTTIKLLPDGTYTKTTVYLGKNDDPQNTYFGHYVWNQTGNKIYLTGLDEDQPSQYFVAEDRIIQLDVTGGRIAGELANSYILNKQSDL